MNEAWLKSLEKIYARRPLSDKEYSMLCSWARKPKLMYSVPEMIASCRALIIKQVTTRLK